MTCALGCVLLSLRWTNQLQLICFLPQPTHPGLLVCIRTTQCHLPPSFPVAGLARRALDEALQYSLQRKTMGKPIAQHQAVAFMLADMATGVQAARLLTWQVSSRCSRSGGLTIRRSTRVGGRECGAVDIHI